MCTRVVDIHPHVVDVPPHVVEMCTRVVGVHPHVVAVHLQCGAISGINQRASDVQRKSNASI